MAKQPFPAYLSVTLSDEPAPVRMWTVILGGSPLCALTPVFASAFATLLRAVTAGTASVPVWLGDLGAWSPVAMPLVAKDGRAMGAGEALAAWNDHEVPRLAPAVPPPLSILDRIVAEVVRDCEREVAAGARRLVVKWARHPSGTGQCPALFASGRYPASSVLSGETRMVWLRDFTDLADAREILAAVHRAAPTLRIQDHLDH